MCIQRIYRNVSLLITRQSLFIRLSTKLSYTNRHMMVKCSHLLGFPLCVRGCGASYGLSIMKAWGTIERVITARTSQWHHNECDGASNHQHHDYLLNSLFGRLSDKTSNIRVTGLCDWNSPVTGEFPAQMASNAENVSIWWHHHALYGYSLHSLHPFFQSTPQMTGWTRAICFNFNIWVLYCYCPLHRM